METNLFNTGINEEGKILLKKTQQWATILYTCTLVTCLFNLINCYTSLKWYFNTDISYFDQRFKIYYIVNAVFLGVYGIMLPVQVYLFYTFIQKVNKAVWEEDENGLNASFKWLLWHTKVASLLFALNGLWAIYVVIFRR